MECERAVSLVIFLLHFLGICLRRTLGCPLTVLVLQTVVTGVEVSHFVWGPIYISLIVRR